MSKKVNRSWGYYKEYFRCKFLCIKTLHFKKHSRLSVQRHKKRNEIWISLGSELDVSIYSTNQLLDKWGYEKNETRFIMSKKSKGKRVKNSFLIKRGKWHTCFAHDNSTVLEIQFGSHVKEEDIERL